MDSYLANIDVYMQERQHQVPASNSPSFEPQQPPRQQMPQQPMQPPSIPLPQQQQPQQLPFNDAWLSTIPDLPPTPVYNVYKEYPSASPFGQNNYNTNNYPPSTQSSTSLAPTQPIKYKKKPGRKPNPASPAIRKAQNRAAQRAFRERKERHLKELETTIRNLRESNRKTKAQLDAYKAESWYLRGVVLTLQFVCMYYQINIPTHSPYMSKEDLIRLMEKSPKDMDARAMEAYLEACERNDKDIKSIHEFVNEQQRITNAYSLNGAGAPTSNNMKDTHMPAESIMNDEEPAAHGSNDSSVNGEEIKAMSMDNEEQRTVATDDKQERQSTLLENDMAGQGDPSVNDNIKAIQQIRLQLGVQAVLSNTSTPNQSAVTARLKPTLLQLSIPHDPRIDLIPTPHTRDRFIIFRDQFAVDQKESNYDKCFNMLLSGAVFHGGDPTLSECWELPEDYFSEYWFLTINYDDLKGTNKWRRQKGLSDVAPGPQRRATTGSPTSSTTAATNASVNKNNMPSLEQVNCYNAQFVDTSSTFQQQELRSPIPANNSNMNANARLSLDDIMRDMPVLERRHQQQDMYLANNTTTMPAPFDRQHIP